MYSLSQKKQKNISHQYFYIYTVTHTQTAVGEMYRSFTDEHLRSWEGTDVEVNLQVCCWFSIYMDRELVSTQPIKLFIFSPDLHRAGTSWVLTKIQTAPCNTRSTGVEYYPASPSHQWSVSYLTYEHEPIFSPACQVVQPAAKQTSVWPQNKLLAAHLQHIKRHVNPLRCCRGPHFSVPVLQKHFPWPVGYSTSLFTFVSTLSARAQPTSSCQSSTYATSRWQREKRRISDISTKIFFYSESLKLWERLWFGDG